MLLVCCWYVVGMLLVCCWPIVSSFQNFGTRMLQVWCPGCKLPMLLVCCWYVVGMLLAWFVRIMSRSQNFGPCMLLQVYDVRDANYLCLVCCWYVVGMLLVCCCLAPKISRVACCYRYDVRDANCKQDIPATSAWGFCCHLMWLTCLWECSAAFHTS